MKHLAALHGGLLAADQGEGVTVRRPDIFGIDGPVKG
jgi:hypothetical protein